MILNLILLAVLSEYPFNSIPSSKYASHGTAFSRPLFLHPSQTCRKSEDLIFVPRTPMSRCAVNLFNATHKTWLRLPPLQSIAFGSKVVLFDQWSGTNTICLFDFMCPGKGWKQSASMLTGRKFFASAILGGTLFVAGRFVVTGGGPGRDVLQHGGWGSLARGGL